MHGDAHCSCGAGACLSAEGVAVESRVRLLCLFDQRSTHSACRADDVRSKDVRLNVHGIDVEHRCAASMK